MHKFYTLRLPTPYDYIITGGGCAGLSLAMHLIASGKFSDKKILLIDQDAKKANDRTWCFWEKNPGLFEPIVFRQWQELWFHEGNFSKKINIAPFHYKMIRGIDFYEHCLNTIAQQPNFTLQVSSVDRVFSTDKETGVVIGGEKILCNYAFNSISFQQPAPTKKNIWLLQHFKGWVIETEKDFFDSAATLMDFRIDQSHGTAFCYVLPLSATQALVEYTLFSPSLLQKDAYDNGLLYYITQRLKLENYKILHKEFGVIPMTNHTFSAGEKNLINIGTAGGQTKGSSGYTFNFIQKHSRAVVNALLKNEHPLLPAGNRRFSFYDSVLLNVLHNNRMPGKKIFSLMFQKNTPQTVLRFLDNESSITEDLKIISSLPTMPFLKGAMQQIF
ncbi:MAG: lycopene cyclase family protein [Bacteroidota bacterium]